MYIEIMDNTIEPETRIRMTITQWVSMTIGAIGIIATISIYFGWIPAKGSSNTELRALSSDYASKEYVSANYISKDKLTDTVSILQNQISAVQAQQLEYFKAIDRRQERIEGLLLQIIANR